MISEAMLHEGRVVRVDAKLCHVEVEGSVLPCAPRGHLFDRDREERRPVAVGDLVRVDLRGSPGAIEERLPRKTVLFRAPAGAGRRPQVLVANADRVLVVGSLRSPPFSTGTVDRVLAAAEHGDLDSAVCLNKIDLGSPSESEGIDSVYRRAGYRVLPTSALRGDGLEALREELRGRVTVFTGLSGVGKSTLLNALQPGLKLRTAPVSGKSGEGTHATTGASLLRLGFGGHVVDTPGVRSFSLWQVEPSDVRLLFREFRGLEGKCRYSSCAHRTEPDCAARAAVEAGEIPPSRFRSYLEIVAACERERRAASVAGKREGWTRPARMPRAPIEADDEEERSPG